MNKRELTPEQFNNELFSLNPTGDPNNIYNYLYIQFIEKDVYTFTKELITFEFIVKKYQNYLKWWNHIYGDKDPTYIGKNEKLKGINDFLIKSMYEQDFEIKEKSRDTYLFGTHQRKVSRASFMKQVRQSLINFKLKITNGTKQTLAKTEVKSKTESGIIQGDKPF